MLYMLTTWPFDGCTTAPTGDFWHERGVLPVEPLNKVLEEVSHWRRPTIMLVGNHDQVHAPRPC